MTIFFQDYFNKQGAIFVYFSFRLEWWPYSAQITVKLDPLLQSLSMMSFIMTSRNYLSMSNICLIILSVFSVSLSTGVSLWTWDMM